MLEHLDISLAEDRIAHFVRVTPILFDDWFRKQTGCRVLFKCENLQKVGAFKIRGATNFCLKNREQLSHGVTTHSSGNHAQALAHVAMELGIPAHIVMPENSPRIKVRGVQESGATITFCAPTQQDRVNTMKQVQEKTGAVFVPPYDHEDIIEGQGTCAYEIHHDVIPDYILTPVGGGGLLSGTILACRELGKNAGVIGTEPEGADDAYRSFKSGTHITEQTPNTIADGLRTTLGELPFQVISEYAEDILLCNDDEIRSAMLMIMERLKLVVEPSAAVPLAALIRHKERFAGKTVVIILSGGNVDLSSILPD